MDGVVLGGVLEAAGEGGWEESEREKRVGLSRLEGGEKSRTDNRTLTGKIFTYPVSSAHQPLVALLTVCSHKLDITHNFSWTLTYMSGILLMSKMPFFSE